VVVVSAVTHRRLWRTAGWLAIAHVVLLFAGVTLQYSLQLGDKTSAAVAALVGSSMTKVYAGGYLQFLGFLVFLVMALLLARLVRGEGETSAWLSSCIAGSAIIYVAVTIATGYAAGGAALYDGHHGVALATVTTVNDIRNFGFFLSGAVAGLFALSVGGAGLLAGKLPRWLSYAGIAIGVIGIGAVPASRLGVANAATILWLVWFVALGVVALRNNREAAPRSIGATMAAA
jgi:hypothetical protein